ncbi:hypothetical protein AQZ49_01440 [Novosphingobium sp. FSW06-99]|nr:hypothetical protein AQZ49_01440 [Novosphingobium sp. FSW06-99]
MPGEGRQHRFARNSPLLKQECFTLSRRGQRQGSPIFWRDAVQSLRRIFKIHSIFIKYALCFDQIANDEIITKNIYRFFSLR